MKIAVPLALTLALAGIAWAGIQLLGLYGLFGIVVPYVALASFVVGFVYRLVKWGRSAAFRMA